MPPLGPAHNKTNAGPAAPGAAASVSVSVSVPGDYVINAKANYSYGPTPGGSTGTCTLTSADSTAGHNDTTKVSKSSPTLADEDALTTQTIAHLTSGSPTITENCTAAGAGAATTLWSNLAITATQVQSLHG
jgi:hypothetical protein